MRTSSVLLTSLGLGLFSVACAPQDPPEDPEPLGEAAFALTVDQAVSSGCSTSTVKGLGMQIAAEGACLKPGSFVEIPQLDNVVFSDAALPFLEQPARDGLVAALQGAPGTSMQINSALRTVAQQYLLYRWYQLGICGITLAAGPGLSNHETGLALDVQEYSTWKSALTNHGFTWYGSNDVVHFDYTGPGAVNYKGTDVLAFQKLWNKNHPNDIIDEDGIYGPQTEGRLKQSPAGGFPLGPDCNAAATHPDVQLSAGYADAADSLPDGDSAGRADLYEGDPHQVQFLLSNTGDGGAANVDLGVEISEGFFTGIDYLIESDWNHPGTFAENDANSDPANPMHGSTLGPSFVLKMNALAKGETKRLTITLSADMYSIEPDLFPEAHVWVKDIPDAYHQDAWNGPADNIDNAQTFQGGSLQIAAPADIYSHTQWLWDTDRREGWEAANGADLTTHADAGYLSIAPATDGLAAQITNIGVSADSFAGVEIWGRVSGGAQAFLYYTTDASPAFDDALRIPLTLPEGEFGMTTVATAAEENWTGTLTGLALGVEGGGALDLDSVRLVTEGGGEGGSGAGGGSSSGGSGSYGGGGSGGYEEDPTRRPMCSCDLPGGPSRNPAYPLIALLGIGLAMRSRRRGSPGRE